MRTIVIVALTGLLTGCSLPVTGSGPSTEANPSSPENYLGYQPIDPLAAVKVAVFDKSANEMREVLWASVCDNASVRQILPLQSAQVSVSKIDMSGGISYLTAAVSGKTGVYEVTMDYMKYRVEDVLNETGDELIGSARIGVGLRIKAVVVTTETGLNLGSLGAIGAEARKGALCGGISVDVIGIDSADVINLIPLTSEIDQTSIQSALQALASIKTKICDSGTMLTPHVVAIRQAKRNMRETIKRGVAVGIERAESRTGRKERILAWVAPDHTLDKSKWDMLVGASGLSDKSKDELRKLTDVGAVSARLDSDAAMNGTVISALYEKLVSLSALER